jgi:DMSO/TMAO reductase YedYZ molybdopterin-dependent catalytic subunit
MNVRRRAFVAGGVGMVVAFGVVELVHGLYQLVPSVLTAVAQRIIELTPGDIATTGIALVGKAATPILISVIVILTLLFAGFLAKLSLRSRIGALVGVGVLAAVAFFAAFSEPFIASVATVLTVLGSLAVGVSVAAFLLQVSGLPARETGPEEAKGTEGSEQPSPQPFIGRSREAHSRGIAVSRRNFVVVSGAAAVAGVTAGVVGRVLSSEAGSSVAGSESHPLQPSQRGGSSTAVSEPETLPDPSAETFLNVEGMPPLFTPNEDFYLIDTAVSSPRVNRDSWVLRVMGEVDNPIELSYDDLLGFHTLERDITLSCVSNEVGGGLVSNARWTGVLLSDVLNEASLSQDKIGSASEQLVGRSVDGWEAGFLTDLAFDGREAMVAFGMNGEELPLKHGYPVRLVVPGLYGYVSATKWLTEIELTDWGYDAYWIKRGWSKEGPILTQSRIDTISDGDTVSAGTVPVGGVAWAPTRGIERVEVSTDGGETWNDATLAAQLDADVWRQYVYYWEVQPGEYTLKVRATDGEGETQTEVEATPIPSGATGYHTIEVTVS